jgi:rhodanese-related sulfurtransferase
MQNIFTSWVFVLLLGLAPLSQAMTLERVNNDLFATGPTVDQDFLQFKEAFAKGGIQRLILVNGPGGDLWTGMQIARMVQEAKIKTVASGQCMSACSLIFMAGQERAFGSGHLPRMTLIGIHGAHDKYSKDVLYQAMPQIYALYKQQMGEKFDAAVINQALYDIKEASGFLRIREIQRTQAKDRTPWFCPTGQTPFDQCQQHVGKDAYTLGIVTQTQTVDLQLPDSMKIKLGFFGKRLDTPPVDFQDRADQMIDTVCKGQLLCKTIGGRTFKNYLSANENKALAIGWGKTGFGVRWGVDEPGQAMMRALYNCNHAKNNPKLCRLVAVNDHELLPIYDEAETQSAALLYTLKAPTPAHIQAERDEPGTSTPSRLRTGNHVTGMTPKTLEGIERWDTATLVQALKQKERPVVIDTAAFGPVIPGALNLIHSGLAFEDAQQESAYADRFRDMLLAAAPNLSQAVVFYCASSECWLSVNAAMRARQLGYTQVTWYRGGMQAWMQAGLPTVGRVPVAVLH